MFLAGKLYEMEFSEVSLREASGITDKMAAVSAGSLGKPIVVKERR